jgi:hypothetical protein
VSGREVVIDGHNAAHRMRLSGGAESVRDQVVARARAAAPRGTAVTVFFDGHPGAGAFGGSEHRGVTFRFSGDREADEAIVEHVRNARRPSRVTLVTDDLELARRAEQLGAVSIRIDAFFGGPRRGAAREREADRAQGPKGLTPADFGLPEHVDLDAPPAVLDAVNDPAESPPRGAPRIPRRRRRI